MFIVYCASMTSYNLHVLLYVFHHNTFFRAWFRYIKLVGNSKHWDPCHRLLSRKVTENKCCTALLGQFHTVVAWTPKNLTTSEPLVRNVSQQYTKWKIRWTPNGRVPRGLRPVWFRNPKATLMIGILLLMYFIYT